MTEARAPIIFIFSLFLCISVLLNAYQYWQYNRLVDAIVYVSTAWLLAPDDFHDQAQVAQRTGAIRVVIDLQNVTGIKLIGRKKP